MIVLCDCDGVVADFVGGLCRELTARGMAKTPEEITSWELRESLSAEEQRAALEIMAAPGFCHELAWYDGAQDFVRALHAKAGDVHFITSPFDGSETWMRERKAWLSPVIARDRVHFVSGKYKHLFRGDVLIEDHPETAARWCDANPEGAAILLDRPWNRPGAKEWAAHRRMYRAKSFDQALRIAECWT